MKVNIVLLQDFADTTDTIVKWHLGQLGHILPGYSPEKYAQYLNSHYRRGGVPSMFLAVFKDKVIGTAALEDNDMDTHPEFSPWLASLYIEKVHRKKGVGTALVERVILEARSVQVKRLYLFTIDQERFLAGFGWKTILREKYYGESVSVMSLDISPQTPSL